MIRTFDTGDVAPAGVDGTATASATLGPINGESEAVYVKYDTDQASTIDTVIATKTAPTIPILSLTDVKTSGWYRPRAALHSILGVALNFAATFPVPGKIAVNDYVLVSWSGADVTHPVRVYIQVEQED